MKSRILLFTLIISLVAALVAWFHFTAKRGGIGPVLEASVIRDCAPWDGIGYTIDIPYSAGSVIEISIWQSPDFPRPVTYSFPDASGSLGTAVYRPESGADAPLSGRIVLQPFQPGGVLEGRFNFKSENGKGFGGEFKAK